jgi:selenide,water dikinase
VEVNEQLAKAILGDPQTSGGLLISISPEGVDILKDIFNKNGLQKFAVPIGKMTTKREHFVNIIP